MITKNGESTDIDSEQRRQLLDLIHYPLLAVLVAAAGVSVLPTKECSSNAAVDAVVIRGVREADQVATGLGHWGALEHGGRVW